MLGGFVMAEYLLKLEQVASLFEYLEEQLDEYSCDHSNKHTQKWLEMNIPEGDRKAVLSEIEDMGGYCDCEVLMNCYEEYMEELYPEDEE